MTRQLVPLLAVLALVVTAGCLGSSTDGNAQQIAAQASDAIQDVESYHYEMSMRIDTDGQTVEMDADGVANLTSERMRMAFTLGMPRGTVESTQYIVGDTQYVEQAGRWQQQDVSNRDVWNQENRLDQQARLLNNSKVTLVGNETVDGERVYVLEVKPDERLVKELAAQRQSGSMAGVNIKSFTIRQYVSHETHRVRKMTMEFKFKQNGETASAEMSMTMSGFDQPTNITVPSEATGS